MLPVKSIVLLTCRSPFLDDSRVYCPLANLYLKSYLNNHLPRVEVRLGDDEYDISDLEPLERFDAIGISTLTPQRHEALGLAEAIKRRWPAKIVIAGGPHVRHYCNQMQQYTIFDYLVPLDGERALERIVCGLANCRVVSDMLSRDEIANQPRPDRTSANAVAVLRRYRYTIAGRQATTMVMARGCPEGCTFCEDAMTQVRWSSLENIRAELQDIIHLGYRGVYIFDDLFAMLLHKMRPICDELCKRDLVYRCNAQARYFTKWGEEMARLLAGTGCHEIGFGAESGSQQILDTVRKRCTVDQNYKTVEYAKKHGIAVKAFILLGLPGESPQTLSETEWFIRDSGCDDYQIAVYMPFKGTQIRDAIDRGELIDISLSPGGSDGEVTGAYGIARGETAYEVSTRALSADDLRRFRDYLVAKYRPESHKARWADQGRSFGQASALGCQLADANSRPGLPSVVLSRGCRAGSVPASGA